jgi:hypothetical protein
MFGVEGAGTEGAIAVWMDGAGARRVTCRCKVYRGARSDRMYKRIMGGLLPPLRHAQLKSLVGAEIEERHIKASSE